MRIRALLQPAILPAYATGAARTAQRALRGHVRHPGTAATILPAVLERCWDGDRYAASGGQFRQFWARDFGFAAPALVRLGHGARVDASLDWALAAWSRAGRVTTTIFPGARPADIWDYGVDSLPFVLRALRAAPSGERLVERHADLLGPEVRRFAVEVLDPATGLVRADRRFSTHRDTVVTSCNAYANTMVALLERELVATGWFPLPFAPGAADRLVDAFWHGDRFGEGPRGTPEHDLMTGDGNVVPFWLGVVPDDLGAGAMLDAVTAAGITHPLPLRYSAAPSAAEDVVQRLFVPNYQGTAIWTSLGAMATEVALRAGSQRGLGWLRANVAVIERDGTMWEVLDDTLRPYRGRFGLWRADEAMLWGALFLDLLRRPPGPAARQ
ncbi:MAG TPA: hypothetical protein VLM76_11185 [Patescibacteria group bacterium]|nr:hypothetical protein [Patescibacteria group bacterium]